MITYGFAFNYSDLATVGTNFPYPSAYLYISGSAGDIVYMNTAGLPQWVPGALAGMLYPIGATKILASGLVNGVLRTTTATGIVYCSTTSP